MSLKAFSGNISFNAQHSPMGAFMSFSCGHFGTRGGVAAQIGKPGNQDLFVGVKQGGRFDEAPLECLPFFQTASGGGAGAADFLAEQAGPSRAERGTEGRGLRPRADPPLLRLGDRPLGHGRLHLHGLHALRRDSRPGRHNARPDA